MKQQKSICANVAPDHYQLATNPLTSIVDPDIIGASNTGNTVRVRIATISSARAANGSESSPISPFRHLFSLRYQQIKQKHHP